MCLIVVALGAHPRFPVAIAANRDEFFARPTAPLEAWTAPTGIVGGRDLEKGGAWLATSTDGAFAAVTNYRDPSRKHPDPRSRGALVADFLSGTLPAERYVRSVVALGHEFDGFNLIAGDRNGVWYGSNRGGGVVPLGPGIHGISNHLLGTAWPKVRRSIAAMTQALRRPDAAVEAALFELLADDAATPDEDLPDTGVGLELERRLAPAFVRGAGYGTRCSTVLLGTPDGNGTFAERTFAPDGVPGGSRRLAVTLRIGIGATPAASAAGVAAQP